MVLVIAAELDYEVYILNLLTSLLNTDVEEEVFVKLAPDYERSNESGVPLIMKLTNASIVSGRARRTGSVQWITISAR